MSDRRRITISFFLWGCGEGLYLYIWPLYLTALGAGPVGVGLVFALNAATAALVNLPAGHLADRYGRRAIIRASMLVAMPVPLLFALAPHWLWLLPGVILYGASFAMMPAVNAYLLTDQAHDERPHAGAGTFGSVFGAVSLGFVLTPWLGGQLATHLSTRVVFVPAFLCYAASTAIIWWISPQETTHHHRHAPREPRARHLLANRCYLLIVGMTLGEVLSFGFTVPFATPFAQGAGHLGDAWIGLLGSCMSLGEFLLGLGLGVLVARLGSGRTLTALQVLCMISLIWLLLGASGPTLLPAFLLRGAYAASLSLLMAAIGKTLGQHLLGLGFGGWETAVQTALIVASYGGGVLYGLAPRLPFLVALAGLGLCVVAGRLGRGMWDAAPTAGTPLAPSLVPTLPRVARE